MEMNNVQVKSFLLLKLPFEFSIYLHNLQLQLMFVKLVQLSLDFNENTWNIYNKSISFFMHQFLTWLSKRLLIHASMRGWPIWGADTVDIHSRVVDSPERHESGDAITYETGDSDLCFIH